MANPIFPKLSMGQDSKLFNAKPEDPSMQSSMDGGYVVSRAKHTRKPRRTWDFGFTNISETDRQTLDDFWDSVGGGSVIFDWTHPTNGVVYQVRFKGVPQFTYTGTGNTFRWDVKFTVEQA